MESLLRDLKHSLRILTKNRSFTISAVAALALGIGANTAIFTVVNTVILNPLPYPDADQIISIARLGGGSLNQPTFEYLEKNNPGFEDLAAYQGGASMNLTGGDRPERVNVISASPNYFRLFGTNPIREGRLHRRRAALEVRGRSS